MAWKKIVAVGCTHGDLVSQKFRRWVLQFVADYQPHYRVDLGDLIDTASFRTGAAGSKDESRPIGPDLSAALKWIREYKPTHVTWGNHDWRLYEWLDHPNANVAFAASVVWNKLADELALTKCQTRPYTVRDCYFDIGGHRWLHGFKYGQQCIRDTANAYRGSIVMAHWHKAQEVTTEQIDTDSSFCVGTAADVDSMHYASRRHATLAWSHGMVFGEVDDAHKSGGRSKLWLASAKPGEVPTLPRL